MKKILKIIGVGMHSIKHATQEAIEQIKSADKVLLLGVSSEEIIEFCSNSKIENITDLYFNDSVDHLNYDRIKEKILSSILEHNYVCFVVPGHPRLAVTLTQILQSELHNSTEIELIVIPGISSFDTMLNDLQLDPLERGTCILDVNRLLLFNYAMEPRLNYFIYHICSIGNSKTNYLNPILNNQFLLLQEKLSKHYSEDHRITMVSSATAQNKTTIKTVKLIHLSELLQEVNFDCTLFIPGVKVTQSDIDVRFLEILQASMSE